MKAPLLLLSILGSASAETLKLDPNLAPVERVVALLHEIKDRVIEDGAKEKMIYDKYSCWCSKTSARKGKSIEDAKEQLTQLGQEIMKQRAAVASLTAEINGLVEDAKTNEDAQNKATTIRRQENAMYMAESSELKQALAALDKALEVLGAATSSALLQGDASAAARTAGTLRQLFADVPARVADSLPSAKLAVLRESAHLRAGYTPQSNTISGILQEMFSTLGKDLESSTQAEAEKNTAFEGLMETKQTELTEIQKQMRKKAEKKAEAETMLAEATQDFDDTEGQMKSDVEFFDATKTSCEAKSAEWTERKGMRDEEITGIKKAIEILSADDARELFHKAIKPGVQSFLQVGSDDSVEDASAPARKAAYKVLKDHAVAAKSLRLATLAAQVRTAEGGHFDEVMKAIDDMVTLLKEEGTTDAAKRDQCKEEFLKIDSTLADLEWKIEKNQAKIIKLEDLIEKREAEKVKTLEDIKEVKEQIVDMEDLRKEENEAFKNAKADDESAITLLGTARDALKEYYTKNDIPLEMVQKKEPEFAEDPDVAPDATFSDKGNRRVESKGIVGIMTMIIEDLNGEISEGVRNEASAQAAFEKALAAAKKLEGDLNDKKVNLEETIASRKQEKTEETTDLKTNEGDKETQLTYQTEIKPDCDFIVGAFAGRAKNRAAELEGLRQAKDFLAGYKPSKHKKAAFFLQANGSK